MESRTSSAGRKTGTGCSALLEYGVFFVLFSVLFRRLGTLSFAGLTLNQVLIVLLLFTACVRSAVRGERIFRFHRLDVSIFAFAAYLWVSNFVFNSDPAWGERACVDFLRGLSCYLLVAVVVAERRQAKRLIVAYVAGSVALALTADLTGVLSSGLVFLPQRREGLTGLTDHYIVYATYCLMSVPLAYAMFRNTSPLPGKAFFAAAAILLSLSTLFSGSRGAIVSFTVMALLMLRLVSLESGRHRLLLGLSVVGTCGAIALYAWRSGADVLLASLLAPFRGETLVDPSLTGRLVLGSKSLFELFPRSPLFGLGVGSTAHLLGNVTHNQWLQILTELGLVGVMGALTIVYFLWTALTAARKSALADGDDRAALLIGGAGVAAFTLLIWGLYENIGLIQADKALFMLLALIRSMDASGSERRASRTAPSLRPDGWRLRVSGPAEASGRARPGYRPARSRVARA